MNRLTGISLNGVSVGSSTYDVFGRMTSKTNDGGLVFATDQSSFNPTNKPHALRAALTNQDVFPEVTQSIEYAPFDKMCHISEGGNTLSYDYGFDHQRIKMTETVNGISRQKFYLNNCEVITTDNSRKELTFISGPIGVFAVVENNGNTSAIHYIHKDHLGSWTTITNGNGQVEQEASFDAWGNLRDPDTWTGETTNPLMFDRGYTGHEHLRGFGLINMNGRMYDPVMSSFLSVDRYVQQPENSQSFNRYAYCMYNPLKYVDPSGWLMSRPSGSGGIPPQFTAPQPVAVDGGYQLAVIDGMLYGGRLNEVEIIDTAITSSGVDSWARQECQNIVWENNGGGHSAEYDGGEVNVPTISGGGGGRSSGGFGHSTSLIDHSSTTVPTVPEMHMVCSQIFTYDGMVYTNSSKYIRIDAGQHVKVEIKNINEAGVVLHIQDATTYHYTKTLLGFPKIEYTGENHNIGLLPGRSISYDFYRHGYVPINWLFEISTSSDVASVRVVFYSEWQNGMSPDPNHPKYKNKP